MQSNNVLGFLDCGEVETRRPCSERLRIGFERGYFAWVKRDPEACRTLNQERPYPGGKPRNPRLPFVRLAIPARMLLRLRGGTRVLGRLETVWN